MVVANQTHLDGHPVTKEELAAATKLHQSAKKQETKKPRKDTMAALNEKRTAQQDPITGAKRRTLEAWAESEPTAVAKVGRWRAVLFVLHRGNRHPSQAPHRRPARPRNRVVTTTCSEKPAAELRHSSPASMDIELPEVTGPTGIRHYAAGWPSKEVLATEMLYKM